MKFFALLAATIVAVVAAADVPACDLAKLVAVSTSDVGTACSAAAGEGASAVAIPTGATLVTVCTNMDCKEYFKQLTAAVPTECTYEGVLFKSTVIDKVPAACASVSSSNSSANSTKTNSTSTTAPTTAPTTVPTTTPASTDKTSNSSATTTAPTTTPAPTSGASTAVAAIGAVTAAVVASLL